MNSTYETWASAFDFTDDLKALEDLYYQQHQELLRQQIQAPQDTEPVMRQQAVPGAHRDEVFLDNLGGKIARRLADKLSDKHVFQKYLELEELQRDNYMMAHQIESLQQRIQRLEEEIHHFQIQEKRYKHLVGQVYYKYPNHILTLHEPV